jgi:hypothetical protein
MSNTLKSENRRPHELMSNNYCGPSKMIPLNQIRHEDGFRFLGIDRNGGEHSCIVRKGDSGSFYMSSNTVTFDELIGWLPDVQVPNAKITVCDPQDCGILENDCPFSYTPGDEPPIAEHEIIVVCVHCAGDAQTYDPIGRLSCFPCAYHAAN